MQSPEVPENDQAAAVPLPETPAPVEVVEPVSISSEVEDPVPYLFF